MPVTLQGLWPEINADAIRGLRVPVPCPDFGLVTACYDMFVRPNGGI